MLILFCDTHELLRAAHFRNSTIHSHIAGFHPAFMLMSGAGLKVFPSCEQAPTCEKLLDPSVPQLWSCNNTYGDKKYILYSCCQQCLCDLIYGAAGGVYVIRQ